MDSAHFDRLSITLASGDTRRTLLRLLLALPLSAGLAGWLETARGHEHGHGAMGEAGRRHKGKGKGKRKGKRKRKGQDQPGPTPELDVQAAIDRAAPGATVVLPPGTWVLARTLVIAKDLTLAGAGAGQSVLDGGNAVRVLQIAPDTTVTVQDLTITRGRATQGGGILNEGRLTLRGMRLVGNTAVSAASGQGGATLVTAAATDGAGGGVSNSGALATLLLAVGGAVAGVLIAASHGVVGGGIHNDGGTVTLDAGSKVTQNTASQGAGIFNDGGTVAAKAGSSVTDNTASTANGGGGIYDKAYANGVSLYSTDQVTYNHPDNCFPLNTIPYCYA